MDSSRLYPELPTDDNLNHNLLSESIGQGSRRKTRNCQCPNLCLTCEQFNFVNDQFGRISINDSAQITASDNNDVSTNAPSLRSTNPFIFHAEIVSEIENEFQLVTLPEVDLERETQTNDKMETKPMRIEQSGNSTRSPHHTEPKRLWTADDDQVIQPIRLKCESCEREQPEPDMHYCSLCLKGYCIYCIELDHNLCQCKRCLVLNQIPIRPHDLEQLQPRDLIWYLTENGIPFTNDMSKRQLVLVASNRLVRNSVDQMLATRKVQPSQPQVTSPPNSCDQCNSCAKNLGRVDKIFCPSCLKQYCVRCIETNDFAGQCKRCVVFSQFPIDPIKLCELHISDLQWFLISQNIAYEATSNKKQLTNLILDRLNSCTKQQADPTITTYSQVVSADQTKKTRSSKKSRARLVKCNSCEKKIPDEDEHVCSMCGYVYCIMCVELMGEQNASKCRRCLILHDPAIPVLRDNLEQLHENDLRWYLYQMKINFSPLEKKQKLIAKILLHAHM